MKKYCNKNRKSVSIFNVLWQRCMAVITVCAVAVAVSAPVAYAEKTTAVSSAPVPECGSAVLMEASTGKILYEKNADEALPPASVTKIMTLLLIMEAIEAGQINYTDMVSASAHACSMGGSQIYLKEGEQMSVGQSSHQKSTPSSSIGPRTVLKYASAHFCSDIWNGTPSPG